MIRLDNPCDCTLAHVSRKGDVPKWVGAVAVVVGIAMVAVMTTSYMMPARPVWATPDLYLYYYYAQAVVAGGIVAALLGLLKWKNAEGGLGFAAVALICALVGVLPSGQHSTS